MSTGDRREPEHGRREYVLAELRCALLRAKLAALEIEAIATALRFGLVEPEQAVHWFWESHARQFLGIDLGTSR